MDATARSEVPGGYELRRPRPEEVAAVVDLGAASDLAVGSEPTLTEGLVRQFWGRPRFLLSEDAWMVEAGDRVVGYGEVWEESPTELWAYAIVHPEHLGRGLGTLLATLIERRARERARGEARLTSATTTGNDVGARLLSARGYTWARRFRQMQIELDGASPASPVPGITLRSIDPAHDLPPAYRVLEAAFEDHWNYRPRTFHDFLEQTVHAERFDPDLCVLAWDGDQPVGALVAMTHPDGAWVDQLGVARSHRGRGIGAVMLRTCFARCAERGLPRARLSVDSASPTGAVGLYEQAGMRTVNSYDLWLLPIP
jgi:mycothiol synthase